MSLISDFMKIYLEFSKGFCKWQGPKMSDISSSKNRNHPKNKNHPRWNDVSLLQQHNNG